MHNIFKSYIKSYLKNWIEAVGSLIFVILIFTVIIGILGTPVQFNQRYNYINSNSNLWNYNINFDERTLGYDYCYDHFQTEHGTPLINVAANIPNYEGDFTSYMQLALQKYNHDHAVTMTFNQFIGLFIKNNLLNLKSEELQLPDLDNQGKIFKVHTLLPGGIINRSWVSVFQKYHDLLFLEINDFAVQQSKVLGLKFESDVTFYYEFNGASFYFEPLDLYKTNNLVLLGNSSKLPNNNQAVISEAYARYHHLNLQSNLKISNISDFSSVQLSGYGNKIADIFPIASFNAMISDIKNYCVVYLNDNQFDTYYHQLKDTKSSALTGIKNFNVYVSERLISNSGTLPKELLQYYVDNHIDYDIVAFNSLDMIQGVKAISIQVLIFGILGIVLLILAFCFINFITKREIHKSAGQIGLFKAMGYEDKQLSWIFTTKTFITITCGAALGYSLSIPLQQFVHQVFVKNINMALSWINTDALFMVIIFLLVPIIFSAISFFFTWLVISKNALDLINNNPTLHLTAMFKKKTHRKHQPWFLKNYFNLRMQLTYAKRGKGKLAVIFILFVIMSFLMIIEFDGINVIHQFTDSISNRYTAQLDHIYSFNENNFEVLNNKIHNKNNQYQFNYYKNDAQLIVNDTVWNRIIDSYDTGWNKDDFINNLTKLRQMIEISTDDFNHTSVNFNKLLEFVKNINQDLRSAYNAFKNPELLSFIDYTQNFIDLYGRALNKNAQIEINNIFAKSGVEEFTTNIVTKADLSDNLIDMTHFNLNLISNTTKQFIRFQGISQLAWNKIINWPDYQKTGIIPILVTNRFAILNHKKIGDNLKMSFQGSGGNLSLTTHIEGIISNDNFSESSIYTSSTQFQKYLMLSNSGNAVFNHLYSENDIIPNDISLDNLNQISANLKVNMPYVTFGIKNPNNLKITFKDLLKNITKAKNPIGIPFLSDTNLSMIKLQSKVMDEGISKIASVFKLFQAIDAFVLLVILFVLTSSVVEDGINFIAVLQSFGYRNKEINKIITSSYLATAFLGFIVAYCLSILMWYIVSGIVFNMASLIITIPFAWLPPVVTVLIVGVILGITWFGSIKIIKNNNITKLVN